MVMNLHVELHHLIQLERRRSSAHRHAQGVAYEIAQVMLPLLEQVALGRIFDVRFQIRQPFLAGFLHHSEHSLERIHEKRLRVLGGTEH